MGLFIGNQSIDWWSIVCNKLEKNNCAERKVFAVKSALMMINHFNCLKNNNGFFTFKRLLNDFKNIETKDFQMTRKRGKRKNA